MIRLSAFADEISPDLEEQIAVLSLEHIHFLDLRGVWNTNVLDECRKGNYERCPYVLSEEKTKKKVSDNRGTYLTLGQCHDSGTAGCFCRSRRVCRA